jgi:hypothetical protein
MQSYGVNLQAYLPSSVFLYQEAQKVEEKQKAWNQLAEYFPNPELVTPLAKTLRSAT